MNLSIKNVPNILTVFRLLMVPVFVYVFFSVEPIWALAVFVINAASDVADGFIARRHNAVTDFGKLMDPLADKLNSVSAIVCLAIIGHLPIFAVIIIAVKELLMVAGGIFLYNNKITVFANIMGKAGAAITFTALSMCFLHEYFHPWDWYVLYFALAVQVIVFIQYGFINLWIPYKKGELFRHRKNTDSAGAL
ncbi:MAG TPA: CDP-alcohol phosphatidyltransferase family protein [Clostridia bacterium]|nr:CDP-alcohol phosphatidyltransferase family protein [Clostridia bacterium]